jgi:hypothetical protein
MLVRLRLLVVLLARYSMVFALGCWDSLVLNVSLHSPRSLFLADPLDLGAPVIIARIKPGRFTLVLRNLHLSATVVNVSTAFLVLTLIPLETILRGVNVLSILAEVVNLISSSRLWCVR